MTVYERICLFETNFSFRFNHKGRKNIGVEISRIWKSNPENLGAELPTVISQEPGGTFRVFSYPDAFSAHIDSAIANYVQRVVSGKKKIIEPENTPNQLKTTSEPRKRKRIQPPAFSGKQLLKKK